MPSRLLVRPLLLLVRAAAALAVTLAVAQGGAALAQDRPLPEGVTGIGLLDGWVRPDGVRVAAIRVDLAPGWHTYWRTPGSAGQMPGFDWSASSNLASVAYEWPAPIVFDFFGIETIGYKDTLVLPVVLTPQSTGAPINVDVDAQLGLCKDICTSARIRLASRLAPGDPEKGSAEIEAALASRPVDSRTGGVTRARCDVRQADEGLVVVAAIGLETPTGPRPTVVIEATGQPDVWIGEASIEVRGREVEATARLAGGVVDRSRLRLTLLDDERAVDIRGCMAR